MKKVKKINFKKRFKVKILKGKVIIERKIKKKKKEEKKHCV